MSKLGQTSALGFIALLHFLFTRWQESDFHSHLYKILPGILLPHLVESVVMLPQSLKWGSHVPKPEL